MKAPGKRGYVPPSPPKQPKPTAQSGKGGVGNGYVPPSAPIPKPPTSRTAKI